MLSVFSWFLVLSFWIGALVIIATGIILFICGSLRLFDFILQKTKTFRLFTLFLLTMVNETRRMRFKAWVKQEFKE